MTIGTARSGHLIAGAAAVVLIVALFLPWADAGGESRSGWELFTMADVFLLIAGLFGITAAVTGGRFGLFRPDVSLIGATDILGVIGSVLLAWLLIFDFPAGADRQFGAFLALLAAFTMACAAGDWRPLRSDAPLFQKLP